MRYARLQFIILLIFLAISASLSADSDYLDTPREIRIGLTLLGSPSKVFVTSSNSVLSIISLKNNQPLFCGTIKNLSITAKKAGNIYLDLGETKILASGPLLLSNSIGSQLKQDSKISLKPSGKTLRSYRGDIEVSSRWQSLNFVNIIDIEEYLQSVVPSEISTRSPKAAQEAQAIAARTYTVRNINRHIKKNYNLCDRIHCQAYFGTIKEFESSTKAVKATLGKILSYKNTPANSVYHSNCGGYIISSQTAWGGNTVPYLIGHFDGIRGHKSFCEYGKQYLSRNTKFTLPAKTKKLVIGITEANCKKKTHDNFGHRVGMCQDGAIGMAVIGYSCSNILGFYYPRTKIETLKYAGKTRAKGYQATKVTNLVSLTNDTNKKAAKADIPEKEIQQPAIASPALTLPQAPTKTTIASESIMLAKNSEKLEKIELANTTPNKMEAMDERLGGIKHILKLIGTTKPNYTSNAIKKLFWSQTDPNISTKFAVRARRRKR